MLSERQFMFKSLYKDLALKNIRGKVSKNPKTFRMEVNEKKIEIQKLVHKRIASIKMRTVGHEKPVALEALENGLKTFFFGENGEVTRKYPSLNKEFKYHQYKRNINLQQKINMGPLTYYYFQDSNDRTNQKKNEMKKCALKRSGYFIIENDKEIDDFYKNKILNSRNRNRNGLSNLTSTNYYKTSSKGKDKEHLMTSSTTQFRHKRNHHSILMYNSNDDCQNIYKHHTSLSNRMELQMKQKKITKKLFKSIISKASVIQNKQEHLGRRLFKIIDKAHIEKPMNPGIKNDVETIFGMKIKKKWQMKTKELVIQAVRVKDDYTNMDKKKADMLKISDGIKNMTNEYALNLGKELSERYWKQSKGDRYSMPLEMVKEQERNHKKKRKRIDDKTFLLHKMEFHFQKEKNHLFDMINAIKDAVRS